MFGKSKASATESKKKTTTKKDVIETVRRAFETTGLKYNYNSAREVFITCFEGDDLPITINIAVHDRVLRFVCPLDLKAKEGNYKDVLWELNGINKDLLFGAFYLDPEDGMIAFEYSFPFMEADVSPEFVLIFIKLCKETVDAHDGDLKAIGEYVSVSHRDTVMYG